MPVFLDLEASSLASGSYPIEVAWGQTPETIESYLISPEYISSWTDWSPVSERLHGIPRTQLLDQGKPPSWVAKRMNDALGDQTVYSDNPDYDRHWLDELFKKAKIGPIRFSICGAHELLIETLKSHFPHAADISLPLQSLKHHTRLQMPQRHRTDHDVAYLCRLFELATTPNNHLFAN